MNPYLGIVCLAAFIGWSGFMYYEGYSKESAVCARATQMQTIAQQSVTMAAEKRVIETVAHQQAITQGVEHDYQANKNAIDSQYAAPVSMQPIVPAAARSGLPAACHAPGRPHAASPRPLRTKVFKLSAQECDDNTAQLYGLQAWVKQQSAPAH